MGEFEGYIHTLYTTYTRYSLREITRALPLCDHSVDAVFGISPGSTQPAELIMRG